MLTHQPTTKIQNENDNNDDENDAERAGVRFATTTTDEEGNKEDIEDEEGNEEDIEDIEQKYGKRTTAHNLRPRNPETTDTCTPPWNTRV